MKNGIYAVNFGGGQVDITNGKVRVLVHRGLPDRERPDRRAGEGRDADRQRRGRADPHEDGRQRLRHGPGIGTCGRGGQGVPVGVGQPTMLIEGLTVGGTAAA